MAPSTKTFEECRAKLAPSDHEQENFWYIIVGSALVTASSQPRKDFGELYTYLINEPDNKSPERRQAINRQMRSLCIQMTVLVGAPRMADAFLGLIDAEEPGDANMDLTKKFTELNAETSKRGTEFLNAVYGEEAVANMAPAWGADVWWLTRDVVYGLFFADDGVFTDLQSEYINYTSMAAQRLPRPQTGHLKGLMRMGASLRDAQKANECARLICGFVGQDTTEWLLVSAET